MATEPEHHPPSAILDPRPLLLAGPTAVGKSQTALRLAEKLDGEIVSVDFLQRGFGLFKQAEEKAKLALELDRAMREKAPAHWKEDVEGPKGIQVLNALFRIMGKDREATLAVFEIVKNQPCYS